MATRSPPQLINVDPPQLTNLQQPRAQFDSMVTRSPPQIIQVDPPVEIGKKSVSFSPLQIPPDIAQFPAQLKFIHPTLNNRASRDQVEKPCRFVSCMISFDVLSFK